MKIIPVIPEKFKMDGGACFGVVPKSIWSKTVPSDENNMVNLSSRCMLIDKGERKILVDTGMGIKQSEKYFSYFHPFDRIGLAEALKGKGYDPNDITDVILTHLHFDHVGGAVNWASDGATPLAAFPKATYYCSKMQWDSAMNPNPREKASYFAENYSCLFENGQLQFIFEESELLPGITLEIKNGHTLGQLIPLIEYMGRTVVFTADFIASVMNIPLAYVPAFDVNPLVSMQEKEEFLNRAVQEKYVLFFEHDYYNECCTLENTSKGIRAAKSFEISDINDN